MAQENTGCLMTTARCLLGFSENRLASEAPSVLHTVNNRLDLVVAFGGVATWTAMSMTDSPGPGQAFVEFAYVRRLVAGLTHCFWADNRQEHPPTVANRVSIVGLPAAVAMAGATTAVVETVVPGVVSPTEMLTTGMALFGVAAETIAGFMPNSTVRQRRNGMHGR